MTLADIAVELLALKERIKELEGLLALSVNQLAERIDNLEKDGTQ